MKKSKTPSNNLLLPNPKVFGLKTILACPKDGKQLFLKVESIFDLYTLSEIILFFMICSGMEERNIMGHPNIFEALFAYFSESNHRI